MSSYIIGLINQGKWRKPDDWGALAAWSWGISRFIDYLEGPGKDALFITKFGDVNSLGKDLELRKLGCFLNKRHIFAKVLLKF